MMEILKTPGGDVVASSKVAKGVVIKPKQLVDPDDVLTRAEAKKVRHGMKQIQEGRFKLWGDVKDELDR